MLGVETRQVNFSPVPGCYSRQDTRIDKPTSLRRRGRPVAILHLQAGAKVERRCCPRELQSNVSPRVKLAPKIFSYQLARPREDKNSFRV